MAGWHLLQGSRVKRGRRHRSTGGQPSLGETAPSDCHPEAGCVVNELRTLAKCSLRVRLIGAGIGFFAMPAPKYSVQVDTFCRKRNGSRFPSENFRLIWELKFAGPGHRPSNSLDQYTLKRRPSNSLDQYTEHRNYQGNGLIVFCESHAY